MLYNNSLPQVLPGTSSVIFIPVEFPRVELELLSVEFPTVELELLSISYRK